MKEFQYTIKDACGIHARPAGLLVKVVKSHASTATLEKDGKSECQEYVQKYKLGEIRYETLDKTGPDHAPHYKVAFLLNGKELAYGEGGSKKAAEQTAAESALAMLREGRKKGKKPHTGKDK